MPSTCIDRVRSVALTGHRSSPNILSDHASTSLACQVASPGAMTGWDVVSLVLQEHDQDLSSEHLFNWQTQTNMSSIVDGILQSDGAFREQLSDVQSLKSSAPRTARSSSRPRGPPSNSTPGPQSDAGLYPDDEIVGARGVRRQAAGGNAPPVVDATGEALSARFEQFLEE